MIWPLAREGAIAELGEDHHGAERAHAGETSQDADARVVCGGSFNPGAQLLDLLLDEPELFEKQPEGEDGRVRSVHSTNGCSHHVTERFDAFG